MDWGFVIVTTAGWWWWWKGWISRGVTELNWFEFGNVKLTGVRVTNPAAAAALATLEDAIGWWNPEKKSLKLCLKKNVCDSYC